jgi:hypothetical protein
MKSIEIYKQEMLKMYRQAKKDPPTLPTAAPVQPPLPTTDGIGGLVVQVTTLKNLYAVPNAKVTVLKDGEVVDTDTTNQSGRTKVFSLSTPSKDYSESAGSTVLPYAVYKVVVEADGFLENITNDVPVFSTVTSIQPVDLMLISASQNGAPEINEGAGEYPL